MPKYTPDERAKFALENNFVYHAPFGDQIERYAQVRAAYKQLAETISELCPGSRELSTAFTNLETSNFWANAAIARNEKPES